MTYSARWWLLLVVAAFLPSLLPGSCLKLRAQAPVFPSANAVAPTDYSKEPIVIERALLKMVFQSDGTYAQDGTERIRIQSQAGLQTYGVLHFPYASATSTMDIVYVRVIKPDKTQVETPLTGVMDMTPDITAQAPSYSDLKDKQIAVKGAEVGDAIEYAYHVQMKSPLVPGQFWFAYNFDQTVVTLDEEVQIGVPSDRYVKIKSPDIQPTTTNQSGIRYYGWKTANLQKKEVNTNDRQPPPSIQLTSFHSWDELGQWFKSLATPQAAVTPPIKAKADELVRDAKTDSDKIHAIYSFVSTNFRYIGISLGVGRYQPHAAADVLANGYGDCKDKHTLIASLLSAEGIKAYPVLIGSAQNLDPEVPSPFWFDHVITAVPQSGSTLFLDATPEVGPFGYLLPNLRDVEALAIPDGSPAQLVKTPADLPFKSFLTFEVNGALDDSGTLDSKIQLSMRGDNEVFYRGAFRETGQVQWTALMQQLISAWGFSGTVNNASPSSPEATDSAFHVSYDYSRLEYADWTNRHIWPPFPGLPLAEAEEKPDKPQSPIELGIPVLTTYEGSLRLPNGSDPEIPPTVDLHQSFADYHAEYSFAGGVMHFQRRLQTKVSEIPVDQLAAYRAFYRAANTDATVSIALSKLISQPTPPELQALIDQFDSAIKRRDNPTTIKIAERAVKVAPQNGRSWVMLAVVHAGTNKPDMALSDIKHAITLDPSLTAAYEKMAKGFQAKNLSNDALELLKALEKARPYDSSPVKDVAAILISQHRYSDAVSELEPATKRLPADNELEIQLGQAYIASGDKQTGAATILKTVGTSATMAILDEAASTLAENNINLDNALAYASDAVKQVEAQTSQITLDDLKVDDVQIIPNLAEYWDTLGWVHFRLNHLDAAEKYLTAAWKLKQDAGIADHLGQLYEKLGETDAAANMYSLAVDTGEVSPETLNRYFRMPKTVGDSRDTGDGLIALRTLKIPGVFKQAVSEEFFVLFSRGAALVLKPLDGSDTKISDARRLLTEAKFDVSFPDNGPTKILRRGIFSCSDLTNDCKFVMFPPDSVTSVH